MIQLGEAGEKEKSRHNPAATTGRSEMSHDADDKGLSRIISMLRVTQAFSECSVLFFFFFIGG